jgi:tRNA A-37 threonylcarbamoyl transferase component Bud32
MKCPRCQNDNPEGTRYCGRCGRELPGTGDTVAAGTATFQTPSRGLERGTTFARRFEIIEEIGKGGMGTVYKAYDGKIREVVALKLLKPEIASDLEIVERFRNEIKLARQVSHRHVCRMYDIGEEWLSIYISMEYVAGEDLKSFIRRSGHLNEAKAVGLARQITEGLGEAHRLGVVHRDLKPQNIMIDKDGNAKIMDFGIARSLHTRGVTGTGVIIGTPEYMAPEQADGRDVDSRADIYALGTVLYEMVTGRVPFEGQTPLSIVLKHRSEPPADPQTVNAQLSTGLSRVILKCLEKARERRYQSAAEVLEDLAAVEKGLPVTRQVTVRTKPVTEREITVKFKLKKILVPALVFGALVVVGLIWRAGRVRDAGLSSGRVPLPEKGTFVIPSETREIRVKTDIEPPAAPAAPESDETAGRHFSLSGKGATSAIMGYLAPFMKDPAKFMGEKDALELEKALGEIKAKYPKEAAALSQWLDNIQVRITEGKKQKEAGNLEASRKSYDRGESEMRKLLAQVSERERAEEAFRQLGDAKQQISRTALRDRPNLLSWIAMEKEKDASDAFAKNDFSGARILCGILTRVHLLSPKAADEAAGLAALRDLTASIRTEAGAASAPQKQAWLYERAKAEEDGAGEKAREGLVPQAAEQYVLAAFLYEKAKEVALESAGAGRD